MNFNYEVLKEFKDDIRQEFRRPIDDLVASNKEVIKTVHELVLTIKDTQKTQEFLVSRIEENEKRHIESNQEMDLRLSAIEKSNYLTWGHLTKAAVTVAGIGTLAIAYLAWDVERKSHEVDMIRYEALEREKYALSIPSPEQTKEISDLKEKLYVAEHKETNK